LIEHSLKKVDRPALKLPPLCFVAICFQRSAERKIFSLDGWVISTFRHASEERAKRCASVLSQFISGSNGEIFYSVPLLRTALLDGLSSGMLLDWAFFDDSAIV
jgi:hypothetical protein